MEAGHLVLVPTLPLTRATLRALVPISGLQRIGKLCPTYADENFPALGSLSVRAWDYQAQWPTC